MILFFFNLQFFKIFQQEVTYISNSLYISLSTKAITISGSTITFLNINECTFLNITSIGDGGAIFYLNDINGKSYNSKNCYYSINCNGWGTAFSIKTNLNNNNNYYFISFLYCSPQSSGSYHSGIEPYNGIQEISNINGSLCFTQHYGCLGIRGSISSNLIFSSFTNCFTSVYISFCFHRYNNIQISNTNFINNSQQTGYGILSNHVSSNTYINKSIFINNGKIGNNCLFWSDGGIFQIKDCYIQSDITTYNVNIINTLNISNTFLLNFLSTSFCKGKLNFLTNNKFKNKFYIEKYLLLILLI